MVFNFDKKDLIEKKYRVINGRYILVSLVLSAGSYIFMFAAKYAPTLLIAFWVGAFVIFYNSVELVYLKLRERALSVRELVFVESAVLVLDVMAVTALVHFMGGQFSPFFSIYMITIFYSGVAMPYFKAAPYVLAAVEGALYAGLLFLEYSGMIPHHPFFGEVEGILFENAKAMALPMVLGVNAVLFSCAYFSYYVSEQLWRREGQLVGALGRAKELQGVSEGKTREAEEAKRVLEQKMGDLERLNKLMVGRELEMMKLKEEVKKLKERAG